MAAGSEPTSLRRCASNYVAIYNRYGCKAGSTEACTKGFAAAIAAVFHAGGGTVHVPGPGAYIAAGVRAPLANVRPHGSSPTRAPPPLHSTRVFYTRLDRNASYAAATQPPRLPPTPPPTGGNAFQRRSGGAPSRFHQRVFNLC